MKMPPAQTKRKAKNSRTRSRSTEYRRRLKENNPQAYERYLQQKRESQKQKRADEKKRWKENTHTQEEIQIYEEKKERERLRSLAYYYKKKNAMRRLTNDTNINPNPTPPTNGKKLKEMSYEERKEYNRVSRQRQRAALSSQKKNARKQTHHQGDSVSDSTLTVKKNNPKNKRPKDCKPKVTTGTKSKGMKMVIKINVSPGEHLESSAGYNRVCQTATNETKLNLEKLEENDVLPGNAVSKPCNDASTPSSKYLRQLKENHPQAYERHLQRTMRNKRRRREEEKRRHIENAHTQNDIKVHKKKKQKRKADMSLQSNHKDCNPNDMQPGKRKLLKDMSYDERKEYNRVMRKRQRAALMSRRKLDRPLLFLHWPQDWPCQKWSIESLAELLKDSKFSCRIWKKSNGRVFETNCEHVATTLSEFCDWLRGIESPDNPLHRFPREDYNGYIDYKYMKDMFASVPQVLSDVRWKDFGLPTSCDGTASTIWIGSEGSNTPCHQDSYGFNLVTQIQGRKLWILFPPTDVHFLYPTRIPYEESSVFSQVNVKLPDFEEHPWFKHSHPCVVVLNPGQSLYVPHLWWHYVESLEPSISINTWVPVEQDKSQHVHEAVTRCLATTLINGHREISPDSSLTNQLLNPTEELYSSEVNLTCLKTSLEKALNFSSADIRAAQEGVQANAGTRENHVDSHQEPGKLSNVTVITDGFERFQNWIKQCKVIPSAQKENPTNAGTRKNHTDNYDKLNEESNVNDGFKGFQNWIQCCKIKYRTNPCRMSLRQHSFSGSKQILQASGRKRTLYSLEHLPCRVSSVQRSGDEFFNFKGSNRFQESKESKSHLIQREKFETLSDQECVYSDSESESKEEILAPGENCCSEGEELNHLCYDPCHSTLQTTHKSNHCPQIYLLKCKTFDKYQAAIKKIFGSLKKRRYSFNYSVQSTKMRRIDEVRQSQTPSSVKSAEKSLEQPKNISQSSESQVDPSQSPGCLFESSDERFTIEGGSSGLQISNTPPKNDSQADTFLSDQELIHCFISSVLHPSVISDISQLLRENCLKAINKKKLP